MTKNIIFLTIFSVILLTPFITKGAVVINEVAWMGTGNSSSDEWIELFSDQQVDLTGWVLEAVDGTPTINLEGTISANGYFLLERTDDNSVPNITADQIYTGALRNSGENLKLKDSNGNIVDGVNCSEGWFAGDNSTKQTMERTTNGWQISLNSGGTPKAQNSGGEELEEPQEEPEKPEEEPNEPEEPTPITDAEIYPIEAFINEFLPSPIGKDAEREWIEIYNDSDQVADISGWQLDDEDGGSKPFTLPENTLIIPKGFLVFPRQITKIALNNDKDKVRLLLPTGIVFQEIIYEKAPEGQSSTKTPAGFIWSTPTPGLPNIINIKEQNPSYNKTLQPETTKRLPEKQQEQDKTYYNLANLEKSTGSNSKLILIILTIAITAFAVGIGIIKFKKKKY